MVTFILPTFAGLPLCLCSSLLPSSFVRSLSSDNSLLKRFYNTNELYSWHYHILYAIGYHKRRRVFFRRNETKSNKYKMLFKNNERKKKSEKYVVIIAGAWLLVLPSYRASIPFTFHFFDIFLLCNFFFYFLIALHSFIVFFSIRFPRVV